jgi:hypothetical protein
VIAFDPHHGKRTDEIATLRLIALVEDADRKRHETLARIAVYLGLAAFCTLFWGGVIWMASR